MTKQEMIIEAHYLARKAPYYRYNPEVLEQIVISGRLPEGVVLCTMGGQKAVREGNEIIITDNNNKEIKRHTLTKALEEKLLIAYAVKESVIPTTMGSLG